MPSSLGHGLIAVAGGTAVAPRHLLRPFLVTGAIAALAAITAAAVTLGRSEWNGHRFRFGLFIAFAALAHGLLDTLTSIGGGIPWPRRSRERPQSLLS